MVTVGLSWVLNFANAVLGVGLLTMPYCFQECGVVLTIMMILLCGHLTKITCQFLLRAGIYTRKSTYEQLSLLVFGTTGKLVCEISMIGVVVGTLVAFQVVIGDLAPAIMSNELGFANTWMMRAGMMIACCGLVLPLCLMRNVASLANFNAISMTFYVCYIFSVFCLSLPTIGAMEWWSDVNFWRPAEFFKCLPIILLSYNCQGQIFIFYAALPDPNMKTMIAIVDKAINLVNTFYITVGMFGYIAFYKAGVGGNILEKFSVGFFTDCMKLGFLLSVIISFPLMCFPVRSSINSLLFADKKQGILHDVISNSAGYIAPDKFLLITLGLVSSTVTVGILIPKVEVVLSITGALAGSFICLVYPSALFLMTGGKDKQRKFSGIVLLVSIFFMISCTGTSLSGLMSGEPAPVAPVDVKTGVHLQDGQLPKPVLPIAKIQTIATKDIKDEDLDEKGKKSDNKIEDLIPLKVQKNIIDKEISKEMVSSLEAKKVVPDLMDINNKVVPDLMDIINKKPQENDEKKSIEEISPKLSVNQSDKVEQIVVKGETNDAGTLLNSKNIVNDTLVSKAENSVLNSNKSGDVPVVEKPLEVLPIKELPEKPLELPSVIKVNESVKKTKLTREILSKQ